MGFLENNQTKKIKKEMNGDLKRSNNNKKKNPPYLGENRVTPQ